MKKAIETHDQSETKNTPEPPLEPKTVWQKAYTILKKIIEIIIFILILLNIIWYNWSYLD